MKKLYILLILLSSMLVVGQTPGGIQGFTVEYWLKADDVLGSGVNVPDGVDISNWKDLSNNNRNFTNTTGFTPRYIKSAMNYHAAVEFYEEEEESASNNRRRKLESLTAPVIDPNRSYYMIWISRLDNESYTSSTHYAPVFTMNSSSNGDNYGWIGGTGNDANKLWHETRGGSYTHSHSGNGYGIGIAAVPNKAGSSSTVQGQYLNGLASTTAMPARAMASVSSSTRSVIGGTDTGTSNTYYYYGEIMEILVLSRPAGSSGLGLSTDELRLLNTHFAIKYGISLDPSTPNYVLSGGSMVYSSLLAGYIDYKYDIFGLARDQAGGLNQKQAMSAGNPVLALSLGDFEETNTENQAVLPDQHALMVGGNGQEGSQPYSHEPGTSFMNYTLQVRTDPATGVIKKERLTTLFNYKLRAKTTGQSSYTVNAQLGMGTWLLVSANPNFPPSQSRIYKVVNGIAKDVVINDGEYIGFTSEFVAPGGVANGLRMWLNASERETISVDHNGEIISWGDHSGIGTTYRKRMANKAAPLYLDAEERTNYHPTPLFREKGDYLITDKAAMTVAKPDNVAFYAVVNHNFATSRSYFIGFGQQKVGTNARRPSFGVYRGSSSNLEGLGRIGSTGLTNSPSRLFNTGATTIAGYHWQVGTGVTFEFDGGHSEFVTHKYDNVLMNGQGMLGLGSSSNSYYLQGVMPEVIMYEGTLNANEKARINAYLGLKYAITIKLGTGVSPNFNYVLSNNTSVWNGNSSFNQRFHHNVAGVVRDDDANLYNKQAKSTDIGAIVHMGVGTKLGVDPMLGGIIQDKSALVWGHNDGSLSMHSFAGNQDICGAMDSKLSGRVWMVENTNFDQSIVVRAAEATFPYNGPNWQVFLLLADSPTKLASNQWDRVVPMDYLYDGHQVNYKFPKDQYTYFTFAAKTLPGICESCDFSGVKKLEFTKNNWARGATSNSYNLGDGFTADVKVSIESPASLRSRYPRPSSLKSLREYRRRGVGSNKMVTEVTLKQNGALRAAASTFEIFEIDRYGGRFSEVEVYGVCGSGIVMPKLSYTAAKKNSYRITGNKAKGYTSSSYASPKGRMYVEFDVPVEKIYVVHKFSGRNGSGTMRIGVGPMEFYCLPPEPAPNEEGLIFTKQGPPELLLCEEATYTFRISNVNCGPYTVSFSDILPAGMKWVGESLSIDEEAVAQATINAYEQSNTLTIEDLVVPGTSTLTFRAKAVFDLDAQAGTYENRGKLSYQPLTGTPRTIELLSCDRLLAGCEPTRTIATGDPTARPLPIEVISTTADKGCYSENEVVTVFIKVKNANAFQVEDMLLELDYNEEFTYVSNSLTAATISLGGSVLVDTAEAGSILIEDFILPPGEHTISFKIKAPTEANLVWEAIDPLDPSQGEIETPLFIDFDLINESDDACLNAITSNAYGSLELDYCVVCYYDPVIGDNGDILDSAGYLAITTLNRPDKSWIPTRGNAFIVLESKTKGLVISRLTTTQIMQLSPVAGMLVYDTTLHCLKMFNGTTWGCLDQGCVDE